MKYLKLYESFEDIESICKRCGIKNYTINEDGSIDADEEVNLNGCGLTKLPLKFRNVSDNFCCYANQLVSLEGCPTSVGGFFDCGSNKLTSLEGCPLESDDFSCDNNLLTSLEGCPKYVSGRFDCRFNKITSFDFCPMSARDFYCNDNPVFEVWRLFMDYSKMEFFNDCDPIRDGKIIILDRLNYFLETIGKEKVTQVIGYICI